MAVQTGIVHIGMNPQALDEARALHRANVRDGGARSIRNADEPDVLERAGIRYDLAGEQGRLAFVASLALTGDTRDDAAALLGRSSEGARDELGQVIELYAQAEKGERRMERMVLSGHSVGNQIWGDGNGLLQFSFFRDLAGIFPAAAATVHHLMISACYTGNERNVALFREAFPELRSLWAYDGSSPGTWSGAIPHMKTWEKATEPNRNGSSDGSKVDRDLADGTRKGEYVVTWNEIDGFQGRDWVPLDQIERSLSESEDTFQHFFSGEETQATSQSGPLRDYYNLVQQALAHGDLDDARRDELQPRRDVVIRLLYWDVVRRRFWDTYRREIERGYASTGLSVPDYSRLERADTLAAVADLEAAAVPSSALELLRSGLVALDSDVILTSWV